MPINLSGYLNPSLNLTGDQRGARAGQQAQVEAGPGEHGGLQGRLGEPGGFLPDTFCWRAEISQLYSTYAQVVLRNIASV